MAISRMQEPRQLYGLGSLVKSIKKGVKTGIKGVTKTIKKNPMLALAALNFAPMLFAGGSPLVGLGSLKGSMGTLFGGAASNTTGGFLSSMIGKVPGGGFTVGAIGSILAAQGLSPKEIEVTKRDPEKLKGYLRSYYKSTNQNASDEEVENFVTTNTAEYYAVGGRVGHGLGDLVTGSTVAQPVSASMSAKDVPSSGGTSAMGGMLVNLIRRNPNLFRRLKKKDEYDMGFQDYLLGEMYKETDRVNLMGGAMPTGIMRANKVGTIERDYRETGGFVPVGIKEKADDVPAMLSKNEFVMTADAVRGMGGGSIEKGAQRLYDQMKTAEKRVA